MVRDSDGMLMVMIQYWYKSIRDKQFKQLDSFKKGAWVHAEAPNELEKAQLLEQFELDPGLLEDALDVDEVPRVESEGELRYIFTRFPAVDDSQQTVTAPVLFVIGPDIFLSITPAHLPGLDHVREASEAHSTQRVKLLLQIMDEIVHLYENRLTSISRHILATRNRLRVEAIRNSDFVRFVTIEDELNDFMGALLPTNTILKRLLKGKLLKLYEADKDLIEDLLLSNEQSIESCKSNIKTIVSIREAYSTIATNNLNQIIRVLTSITVVLTIPTIIGSIYGMNVGLPLQDDPHAFWIIIGTTSIVTGLLLLFFRRQEWL